MVFLFFDANCSLLGKNELNCHTVEGGKFACERAGEQKFFKGAKYCLTDVKNENLVFLSPNCLPLTVNFFELTNKCADTKNAICFEHKHNFYIFLKFFPIVDCFYTQFSFKGANIGICLAADISISINGEQKFKVKNKNLTFSHFEEHGNFCFVHFVGKTNFVAILNGQKIVFANYYHQVNFAKQEFYFLTKLKDTLNQGEVCHIVNNKAENYLVYLDEYDLHLKPEFLPSTFLDCLLAKNYGYCNRLLAENLRQQNPQNIKDFFGKFDSFCTIETNCCALFEKDAYKGICEFEILNDKIVNIVVS